MVRDSGKTDTAASDNHSGQSSEAELKKLESWSYAAILLLIVSVILIVFDQKFISGILVILSASVFIFLTRKALTLLRT
jgi:hypothetical protein